MSRYEKYQKARKEYMKRHERDINGYIYDSCKANHKSAMQNRKASQKYE